MIERLKDISFPVLFLAGLYALLFLLLPVSSPFFEIPYNSKRFFQVLLLVLTGIVVMFYKPLWKEVYREALLFSGPVKIAAGVVFFLGFISSLFSNHPVYALLEWGYMLLLVLLFLLFLSAYRKNPKYVINFACAVLFGMIVLYFFFFSATYIQYFLTPGWPVWPSTRFFNLYADGQALFPEPFLGFVNARFLNHLHTWSLPLLVFAIIKIPKKYWAVRGMGIFFYVFWWMLVFAADARGTMLSSLVSLMVVAFLFRKQLLNWYKLYAGSMLAGLAAYLLLFKVLVSEGSRTVLSRYGDSGRMDMWQNALDTILQHPLLGAGPMHYGDILNGFKFAAPHNIYLQTGSEWGIPVLLIFLSITAASLWKWKVRIPKKNSGTPEVDMNLYGSLTASVVAGLTHGFFSGLLNTPLSQLLMVMVFALAVGVYRYKLVKIDSDAQGQSVNISKKASFVFKIVLLAAVLFTSYGTYHSLQKLDESRTKFLEQAERQTLYPRFWDQGIIGID